ncbi:AAA family ATPase [Niveispirillum fermenti]|uniref:AAA family ATPase n=1 Tax=Niveispirillum fermenti TaxID=1233113 RepID=UPI003A8B6E80
MSSQLDRPPTTLSALSKAYNKQIVEHLDAEKAADAVEPDNADRPTPYAATASVLLDRALASKPEAAAAIEQPGQVVVVNIGSPAWVPAISQAFRDRVNASIQREMEAAAAELREGQDGIPNTDAEGPADVFQSQRVYDEWLIVDDLDRASLGDNSVEFGIIRALDDGKGVLVLVPPEAKAPEIVRNGADHQVSIPLVDAAVLADAAAAAFGVRPDVSVPDRLCRLLTPTDLRFAHRFDEGADQWIERLARLAEAKVRMPVIDGPTLDGLSGMDEAVEWARNLIKDLADYNAGILSADEIDKGCMLVGPPGTGKSTFAARLARSAGLPLVIGSYGQWQSAGHQGHMLKAMRESFEQAQALGGCLFLLEEADSFGVRDKMEGRNREYSIQVVNEALQRIDEAVKHRVIILGVANTLNIDPAFLRPGRFDRVIPVFPPDQLALAGILREHLGHRHLPDADLSDVAAAGLGGTGADVEFWVRNAKRLARRAGRQMIIADLLAQVSPALNLPIHHQRRIAVHEAAHAVAGALELPGQLRSVTVLPNHSGAHFRSSGLETGASMRALIRVTLAGRAGEEIVYGMPANGSGGHPDSDLAKATALTAQMLGSYGFGDGLAWKGEVSPQNVAAMLRQDPTLAAQVEAELSVQYKAAKDLLHRHRSALDAVADLLLDRGTLTGAEVEEIVASMSHDAGAVQ